MDATPAPLVPPPSETDPPRPVPGPDRSRRFSWLDLLIVLAMAGVGQWGAHLLQSILRVAWNFVGTAPWPAYATPYERYTLGALLGLVASGPLVLFCQLIRGRRTGFGTGEWVWLLSACGMLVMVTAATQCSAGLADLWNSLVFLMQLTLCAVAITRVLRAILLEAWTPAWTQVVGTLACLCFTYGMYYAFFVGTISGGRMNTLD